MVESPGLALALESLSSRATVSREVPIICARDSVRTNTAVNDWNPLLLPLFVILPQLQQALPRFSSPCPRSSRTS